MNGMVVLFSASHSRHASYAPASASSFEGTTAISVNVIHFMNRGIDCFFLPRLGSIASDFRFITFVSV